MMMIEEPKAVTQEVIYAAAWAHQPFPADLEAWRDILQLYHDHEAAGHPGVKQMTELIHEVYCSTEAKDFVEEYIKGCTICQETKPKTHLQKASLQPFPLKPTKGPFQIVSMDLITELPKSNGYNAILTIIDQGCSKVAKFLPCTTNITGQQVAVKYY